MKTVVITGVYGFLGRHAAKKFKQEGYRVIGVGRGHWDLEEQEKSGVDEYISGGVYKNSLERISGEIDCVIHCAGSSIVGKSFEHPLKDFQDTVNTLIEVLDFVRELHPKAKVIFISGATVYGAQDNVPLSENIDLHPASPYGIHKKIAEDICAEYHTLFGLSIGIIRSFSLYGPGNRKQLLWDACNKLTDPSSDMAQFWGDGEETRDWFSIFDAVDLIHVLACQPEGFLLINGGSGTNISLKQTIAHIKRELQSQKPITFTGEGRRGDPRYFWADITRAKSLGWEPRISWEKGIADYVKWYVSQQYNVTHS